MEALEKLPLHHEGRRKSLAREDVEIYYKPVLNRFEAASPEDILATLIEHFSTQVSQVVLDSNQSETATLLVTGGGTYNQYFIRRLADKCGKNLRIIIPEPQIIDYKEALVFAFLGVLRLREENNCLSSVTGASRDSCGGVFHG